MATSHKLSQVSDTANEQLQVILYLRDMYDRAQEDFAFLNCLKQLKVTNYFSFTDYFWL